MFYKAEEEHIRDFIVAETFLCQIIYFRVHYGKIMKTEDQERNGQYGIHTATV